MIRIRHAVLAALALAASPGAFALNQAAVDVVVGTNFEFFTSGSSAVDSDLVNYTKNVLCQAGTYDVYQDIDANGVKGGNYKVYTCTAGNAAPVPAALQGQNILIHKREKEGSLYGSLPQARNTYVEFMNIRSDRFSGQCVADASANTFDCTVASPVTNLAAHDLPRHDPAHGGLATETVNDDECDYNTVAPANPVAIPPVGAANSYLDTFCRRATMGFSDTEAEMFVGANINWKPNLSDQVDTDDWTALTARQLSALTRKKIFGQVFGIAVSADVFTALQTAQGITAGAPDQTGAASNWPTLGSDQIRQLLSGNVNTWTQVVGNIGLAGNLNNLAICRRDQGSGTQATTNQYFFNYPCDTQNGTPARDTGGVGVANAAVGPGLLYVLEGGASPYVKWCLNQAAAGQLHDNQGNLVKYGAIGILGASGDPSSTDTPLADTWQWVKIDGNAPTIANAISGVYDEWVESQSAYNATNANANELALAAYLQGALGTPADMTAAGDSGIAAMTYNGGGGWDNGVSNSANFGNHDFKVPTNPTMGGQHGNVGAAFPASGTSPLTCRKIVNQVDNSAQTPNRSR